ATGPTGVISSIHGVFKTQIESCPGEAFDPGTIIPLVEADPANTSSAFTLNPDGSVTVMTAGVYWVEARLQTQTSGQFCIQINGGGIGSAFLNTGGTITSTAVIPTILQLNAGDILSIINIGSISVLLLGHSAGVTTPPITLALFKIS
ncbi:hypothetical protein CN404_30925, partial [Bacillus thuringiensis]|uniref:hypothetical protein n=1 Tax=Bacillus thuringiensis TaxID=1428 RepID=UPI000BF5F77D